ncbi:MAG: DUF1949 domain-containing protein [Balneola sp.]|nr:MAG: DUF1949 domain-containing protein [Balneola sp.]
MRLRLREVFSSLQKHALLNTILHEIQSDLRELGSKFYGFLFPCDSESTFREQLEILKKKYSDASHHCYAYRVDPNHVKEFSSDDGEPSGTAGLPILNQLKSKELVNCGAVVVRYFGGTKLGKPGLIKAYGESALLCIEKAELKEVLAVKLVQVSYPYSEENTINPLVQTFQLINKASEYTENVTILFACKVDLVEGFIAALEKLEYREIAFEDLGESFI